MSLAKSLGYSFILFITLNFLFALILAAITGIINDYFSGIASDPLGLLITLFSPVLLAPGIHHIILVIGTLTGSLGSVFYLLLSLGYILTPIIAALVCGIKSEGKKEAFEAWFLTMLISTGIIIVAYFLGQEISNIFGTLGMMGTSIDESGDIYIISYLLMNGYLNGIFYSAFAMLPAGIYSNY